MAILETTIVMGLLLLVIIGGFDLAIQFHVRNYMIGTARDAARLLAVREGTPEQAKAAALSRLDGYDANFEVDCRIIGDDATVQISVPREEVALGFLPIEEGALIVAESTMRKEN
jgi:hypothetical protein